MLTNVEMETFVSLYDSREKKYYYRLKDVVNRLGIVDYNSIEINCNMGGKVKNASDITDDFDSFTFSEDIHFADEDRMWWLCENALCCSSENREKIRLQLNLKLGHDIVKIKSIDDVDVATIDSREHGKLARLMDVHKLLPGEELPFQVNQKYVKSLDEIVKQETKYLEPNSFIKYKNLKLQDKFINYNGVIGIILGYRKHQILESIFGKEKRSNFVSDILSSDDDCDDGGPWIKRKKPSIRGDDVVTIK